MGEKILLLICFTRSTTRAFIAICLAISFAACTNVNQKSTYEQNVDLNQALRETLDCARSKVASIDDGRSDASTIAFALAGRCIAEYQYSIEVVANGLANDKQRRIFRNHRNSAEGKIEFFLPVVMEYRQTTKSVEPSKEMNPFVVKPKNP